MGVSISYCNLALLKPPTVTNFLLRLWRLTLSLFYSSQIGGVNRSEQKGLPREVGFPICQLFCMLDE
jgi:hypothetical protein